MNRFLLHPSHGPTVPDLSQQVRGYRPRWSPPKKSGPIGATPLKGGSWADFWTGPMEHIDPKHDTKDEQVGG